MKCVMVILEHENQLALEDLVANVSSFCPRATLALYNSGVDATLGRGLELADVENARQLEYAHVAPFFLDVFGWLSQARIEWDYFINLETDMLFIRPGFESFLEAEMKDADYMAPGFSRFTAKTSRWRPIRSLRPQLRKWYDFLGYEYTHRAFSPGQVFSRRYVEDLLSHKDYPRLLQLVRESKSFSLQEVMFPTLVDFLGLRAKSYPAELEQAIRYRPYQAVRGIERALKLRRAHFVHPVRRDPGDPARVWIRELERSREG